MIFWQVISFYNKKKKTKIYIIFDLSTHFSLYNLINSLYFLFLKLKSNKIIFQQQQKIILFIVIQQFDGYKWLSKEFYMKNDFTFLLFQFFSFFIIDCGLFKWVCVCVTLWFFFFNLKGHRFINWIFFFLVY